METNSSDMNPPAPIETMAGQPCPRCSWKLAIALVLIWLLAIGIAFKFDAQIANHVERFAPSGMSIGIISKFSRPAQIIRTPGNFKFTLCVAVLLWIFHRARWRAAALLVLSGIIGGFFYAVIKWTVGRERPEAHLPYVFNHFSGGLKGFLYAERLSFPSGHAMLAFATATVLSICIPRWRVLFFVLACIVGAERVLEHSHYLSDVIAGAGLGVISALVAKRIMEETVGFKRSELQRAA